MSKKLTPEEEKFQELSKAELNIAEQGSVVATPVEAKPLAANVKDLVKDFEAYLPEHANAEKWSEDLLLDMMVLPFLTEDQRRELFRQFKKDTESPGIVDVNGVLKIQRKTKEQPAAAKESWSKTPIKRFQSLDFHPTSESIRAAGYRVEVFDMNDQTDRLKYSELMSQFMSGSSNLKIDNKQAIYTDKMQKVFLEIIELEFRSPLD